MFSIMAMAMDCWGKPLRNMFGLPRLGFSAEMQNKSPSYVFNVQSLAFSFITTRYGCLSRWEPWASACYFPRYVLRHEIKRQIPRLRPVFQLERSGTKEGDFCCELWPTLGQLPLTYHHHPPCSITLSSVSRLKKEWRRRRRGASCVRTCVASALHCLPAPQCAAESVHRWTSLPLPEGASATACAVSRPLVLFHHTTGWRCYLCTALTCVQESNFFIRLSNHAS